MTVEQLTAKLKRVERIENPVSVAAGILLALPYVLWSLAHHRIPTYSWMIPFFIGGSICKLGFASYETRLEKQIRGWTHPELPVAIATEVVRPAAAAIEPVRSEAPEPPSPLAPGDAPRVLK